MTAARTTLLTALDRIDAILKTERQPIDARAINLAVEKARQDWPRWSPGHRYQARWDIEAELEASLRHACNDWATVVSAHKAGALFDDTAREHPSDYYRLPVERAASHALNALRHASIGRRLVSDEIGPLKNRRKVVADASQSNDHRTSESRAAIGTRTYLPALIVRRRRDWQTFLRLLAEYRALKEAAQ